MACVGERRQAESITKVSSTPIPRSRKGAARFKAWNSTPGIGHAMMMVEVTAALTKIAGEAEAGHDGQDGREEAKEADEWL